MRVTSKGQVTIPQEIRERFGFLPETEIEFRVEGNSVRLVKASGKVRESRGSSAVSRLRGTATFKMTTDEPRNDQARVTWMPPAAPVLVDSNVILDIATNDPRWGAWSSEALAGEIERGQLVINPIIYAEVSIHQNRSSFAPRGTVCLRSDCAAITSCDHSGSAMVGAMGSTS